VIRNIPPNTDVERIYIVATNQIGLSSPKGQLKEKVCRTQETSRHGQLVRELNAAAAITGPFFDSDFYTVIIAFTPFRRCCLSQAGAPSLLSFSASMKL